MTPIVPAEWAPHRAMWLGFPSHAELWREDLPVAQAEVAALARALAGPGGERVRLMVVGDAAEAAARALLGDTTVEIVRGQFGDIWLRDTGPIFVETAKGPIAAGFEFNGWGGKFEMEGDDIVAEQIAAASGTPLARNGDFDEAKASAALAKALGAKKVLWLEDGLLNDHTDGHIDNLARFVAPGVVACPMAFGADDPNAEVYANTARLLAGMTDSRGSPLQVVRIPSPGRILDADGEIVPASHMNFLIANEAVIVPIYAQESGAFAVEVIQGLFPEREVIGLASTAILTGGGSVHCISQQEPA